MDSHELANKLLSMPNTDLSASIDISTSEDDSDARLFGQSLCDAVETETEVVLVFEAFTTNRIKYGGKRKYFQSGDGK